MSIWIGDGWVSCGFYLFQKGPPVLRANELLDAGGIAEMRGNVQTHSYFAQSGSGDTTALVIGACQNYPLSFRWEWIGDPFEMAVFQNPVNPLTWILLEALLTARSKGACVGIQDICQGHRHSIASNPEMGLNIS